MTYSGDAAGFDLLSITCCPRCRRPLLNDWSCPACGPYPVVDGKPVLIDFERSIVDRAQFEQTGGASSITRKRPQWMRAVRTVLFGTNTVAASFADELGRRLPGGRLLVIGGGAIGNGAGSLYSAMQVVGTDIYLTPHVALAADGHHLPFRDGSFDAVWIQAVLEHVLSPEQIAGEIHRVLKPDGLVYANTPFMQQVHEGPYDFQRFTLSGHRWLFRRFTEIDSGVTKGAGTALIWSIRYFVRALLGARAGQAAALLFFWLRFFDGHSRRQADGASGVYFFGARSESEIAPADIVAFYARQGRR